MFKPSAIINTDFYKIGHVFQYPEGIEKVYSNLTARSDIYTICNNSPYYDHKIVFFGLQYFIQYYLIDYFNETFFDRSIIDVIESYDRRMNTSLGKNSVPTEHIAALHRLGYLPIEIKALPEGSRVDMRIPLMTITNTLPDFFWVTNFLETALSAMLWKMCNNATIAYEYKRILNHWADKTCDDRSFVQFQGHDFSFRGMSGIEDAMTSGMAHLTSFVGTDTIPAIDALEYYYGADCEKELVGCSVPATEHSVMCAGGKDTELDTIRRLVTEIYPNGIVSIVSDTWDFWKVITEYAIELKDIIMQRDGKVVFRPDSGDPVDIICGKMHIWVATDSVTYYDEDGREISRNEAEGSVECLWNIFGGTINSKGYKVLDPHVGLIYGDSITIARAQEICKRLEAKGFASSNIVFGIGSYTYNYNTRDSFGMAVKATYVEINGHGQAIEKSPKTDNGIKKSATGLLCVINKNGNFMLEQNCTPDEEQHSELKTVFKNGQMFNAASLQQIRDRLNAN